MDEQNAFRGGKECAIGARAGVQYLFSSRETDDQNYGDEETAASARDKISRAIDRVNEALFLKH